MFCDLAGWSPGLAFLSRCCGEPWEDNKQCLLHCHTAYMGDGEE